MSATPLEHLIDALQTALLAAQAVDRATPDLSDESRVLVHAVQAAARCADELRTAGLR
jgi:hypothetical protein